MAQVAPQIDKNPKSSVTTDELKITTKQMEAFLDSIYQSMQESARQQQAMGRTTSHATHEQALRQVQMLQEARDAWEYNSKQ